MSRAPAIFGVFVLIVVGVIVAPSVLDLTSTDTDEHGRIPVPGQRVLELPEGEVGVYYGERRRMPSRRIGDRNVPDALPVPALVVRARSVDGTAEPAMRTAFVDGVQIGTRSRTTRQFAVLEVPAGGDYRVTVRSRERIRYPAPVLSFGSDSSRQTEWGPSEWLLDHIVLVILGGIGLMVAIMLLPSLLGGRRGPPPPSRPGGGAGARLHVRL